MKIVYNTTKTKDVNFEMFQKIEAKTKNKIIFATDFTAFDNFGYIRIYVN